MGEITFRAYDFDLSKVPRLSSEAQREFEKETSEYQTLKQRSLERADTTIVF